ncbi:MAG: hypothetical protein JNK65_02565, partial [Deltaproteobacteria bacterium]|nr:hypothetical protein [Deltaproteobacteria bacterium]
MKIKRLSLLLAFFCLFGFMSIAFAQSEVGFESSIMSVVQHLFDKFPILTKIYLLLCGLYTLFCAVAALTPTDKDDKFA